MAREGMWVELLALEAEAHQYADSREYGAANAATCFLKKLPTVPGFSDETRRVSALASWKAGESDCYWTNQRLAVYEVSPLMRDPRAEFLRRVRRTLLDWVGTSISDESLKREARHGPGTVFGIAVKFPTAADKFAETPSVTRDAVHLSMNLLGTLWMEQIHQRSNGDSARSFLFTRGNKFATVPKTAQTDRCIAIEATLNVYFQLAVGTVLRKRWKESCGWDLATAQFAHRKAAQTASMLGHLATIDLKNASDTVSKVLVKILLGGTQLYSLLDDLRSKHTFIDGRWVLLEKFSSMGNGFTFELESLIFAAICFEVMTLKGFVPRFGENLFVFGDDIIVPTDVAELVVRVLQWLGFTANLKKTFLTGEFRESCGADFFRGDPVRAFYLKKECHYATEAVYTAHNGVARVLQNLGSKDYPEFCSWLRFHRLPARYRYLGGPSRLGDQALHGVDEQFRWKHGIRWIKVVQWSTPKVLNWRFFPDRIRLACTLHGYAGSSGITARGENRLAVVTWVSAS